MKNFIILTNQVTTQPFRINVNHIIYYDELRRVPEAGKKPITVGSKVYSVCDLEWCVKEYPEEIDSLIAENEISALN